jgi:hypothetical protein
MSAGKPEDDDAEAVPPHVEADAKPPKKKRKKRPPNWMLIVVGSLAGLVLYFTAQRIMPMISKPKPKHSVARSFPNRTRELWIENGYVEMVPPLRLPSRPDGSEQIEVWIKFAPTGKIGVKWLEDQKRHALTYPPGTIADRLEFLDGKHVVDVRGTAIGDGGQEVFHVYRPSGKGLVGYDWKRDDPAAQEEATRLLILHEESRGKVSKTFAANNECANCHGHSRAERRHKGPSRATDTVGWFQPESVLRDRVPVEKHRPREMNLDDPFIKFECPSTSGGETQPATFTNRKKGQKWPVCPDELTPIGVIDVKAALAKNDQHARGLCKSREALYQHMDDEARKAFASAFEVCGIR